MQVKKRWIAGGIGCDEWLAKYLADRYEIGGYYAYCPPEVFTWTGAEYHTQNRWLVA